VDRKEDEEMNEIGNQSEFLSKRLIKMLKKERKAIARK